MGVTMGSTITQIDDDAVDATGGVQGQNCLIGDVQSGYVGGFERDLGYLLAVDSGFKGASVRRTGHSSGATRSSLKKT